MNLLRTIFGSLCAPLLVVALCVVPAVAVAQDSLYYRLKDFSERDRTVTGAEKVVEFTVKALMPLNVLSDFQESDVDLALNKNYVDICRKAGGDSVDSLECKGAANLVGSLVKKHTFIRQLSRDLQLAATSYEAGLDYYPGRSVGVMTRLPSITKIWQAETDVLQSPLAESKFRGLLYEDNMETDFERVKDELIALKTGTAPKVDREQFIAAVWRYRHGYKHVVDEEGPCDPAMSGLGDGTSLQFLSARFCLVEEALQSVHTLVENQTVSPPLKPGETVFYPIELFEDDNFYIWVRRDDVGVHWDFQLDPVLPSLTCRSDRSFDQPTDTCKNNVILAGNYPEPLPDPEPDKGVCSHPIAKRGFLCRDREYPTCTEDPNTQAGPEDILLTGCQAPEIKSPVRWTESGPNVCQEGGWRAESQPFEAGADTPDRDTDIVPSHCSRCYVDTVCEPCGGPWGISITRPKEDGSGRIEICLTSDDSVMGGLYDYFYIHELVHAQQTCKSPPGGDNMVHGDIGRDAPDNEGCCAIEYQAYMVQCDAMEEDGILDMVGVDIQTCAARLTNLSCGQAGVDDQACVELDDGVDAIVFLEELKVAADERALETGASITCEEAVNSRDARATRMINSLPQNCDPTCSTHYLSTIGNNACMVGQCLEESLERHRLTPGRMPMTVQDEAFPSESEVLQDPNYGVFMSLASRISVPLPAYRPGHLARQLDQYICSLNGQPLRTPSVLCSFNPARQLRAPTSLPTFWGGVINQRKALEAQSLTASTVAPGIGSRVGNRLYTQYLGPTISSFSDIVEAANVLLTNLGDIEVPSNMCPRNFDNSI